MNLTTDQEQRLAAVIRSANVLDGAREVLRTDIFDALDEGVSLKRVAKASGIAHTTILRWIRAEEQ